MRDDEKETGSYDIDVDNYEKNHENDTESNHLKNKAS